MNLWTDGSCDPNPGPGGWSFTDGDQIRFSGFEKDTTNNRMELKAVIEAAKFLKATNVLSATIHSDSMLTIKCAEGTWKRKANQDLWIEFDKATQGVFIVFKWVKAHSGIRENELADYLARTRPRLQQP